MNVCENGKNVKKRRVFTEIASNCAIILMLVSLCLIGFGGSGAYDAVFSSGYDNSPIYRGENTRAEVALMINVYQGNEYLEDMLDTMKAYGVHCTFFVGGCWADDNNALILRIVEEGHEIGNHGYFHKDAKELTYAQNKNTETIYQRATDKIEAGDMILAHPTYNTAEALPDILKYYKEHGLTAVTVSQIISKTV